MTSQKYLALGLILFVSALSLPITAQKGPQNLLYEDLKPYHLGFMVGVHSQDLILNHSGVIDADGNTWYGSVDNYEPGFSVGVLGDLRLSDQLSLRLTPSIHFGSKVLMMHSDITTVSPVKATIRSNYLLVPLDLRFRGLRTNNYRPYILSGFGAGIDMGRDKMQAILLKPINLYWELGVGMDLYMPYFRLVPELKVCLGIGDVLVHDRKDQTNDAFKKYSEAFDKITSRLIVFSLQFE
jgi:hypothetical protein